MSEDYQPPYKTDREILLLVEERVRTLVKTVDKKVDFDVVAEMRRDFEQWRVDFKEAIIMAISPTQNQVNNQGEEIVGLKKSLREVREDWYKSKNRFIGGMIFLSAIQPVLWFFFENWYNNH